MAWEERGGIMKLIKENAIEIFMLIGISLISIGCFILSTVIGFIITGLTFVGLAVLVYKGGD